MEELQELVSTVGIRSPSNKMEGSFVLYSSEGDELESTTYVRAYDVSDPAGFITVRQSSNNELSGTTFIMYREHSDIDTSLEIIAGANLDAFIEVKPNNRLFGLFELLEPPRINKDIIPTADSTTRSREDLMTINYGDFQRMMVGNSSISGEHLESFIKFGDIKQQLSDMLILEEANLRIYYTGDFVDGTNLELYLPNRNWTEYGITHANKPDRSQFITSEYYNNKDERYIEFEIKETVLKWINDQIENFGLVLISNDNHTTSFQTKEGVKKPSISVEYITNAVYSLGRSEVNSTIFIWGVGESEIGATFTVDSDWGFENKEATVYVHRYEDHLLEEFDSKVGVSNPDLSSKLTIAQKDYDQIEGLVTIAEKAEGSLESLVVVSNPELISFIDTKSGYFVDASLTVRANDFDELTSIIAVSLPDLNGFLTIRERECIEGHVTVKQGNEESLESFMAVSNPELRSTMSVRAYKEEELESIIEIPYYDHIDSRLYVTRPELDSVIEIRSPEYKEGTLFVKYSDSLDSMLTINQIDELQGSLMVVIKDEKESSVTVSKPELAGFLYPRLLDESDILSSTHIRQRYASDVDSYLTVKGGYGAYYFIL